MRLGAIAYLTCARATRCDAYTLHRVHTETRTHRDAYTSGRVHIKMCTPHWVYTFV
ncbi:MAG: hypothetical protein IPK82_03240 [Polyangiaceae bacterium]|nr:hypothetical protein [Polyangiaceae bacterium]